MLNGQQIGKLRDAIEQVFDLQALEQLLLIRLQKKLDNYAPNGGIKYRAFSLLNQANMEGWDEELINALLAERPRYGPLLDIACDLRIGFHLEDAGSKSSLNRGGLEGLVNADPTFDPAAVLQGISLNKRAVCRIQVTGANTFYGTGFLVGPDLLLTNYHVMEQVINDNTIAPAVRCRFDYEVTGNGKNINPGTEIGLAHGNPVLASSKYSEWDEKGSPAIDDVEWPADKLDYALVKLEREIGKEPFGPNGSNADSEARGWIKPGPVAPIHSGSHMIIIQHPDMQPVKIAFGLSRVEGCDHNNRRVRYQINTLNGSSGSPCFDHKFNWIALHNMGDPGWNPNYNQGIPATNIIKDLAAQGINL